MVRLTQAKVYGAQGAFVDLAPYIKKYAPHIQAYIDSNPEYKGALPVHVRLMMDEFANGATRS